MTAARKTQTSPPTFDPRAWRVLWSSTFAFTICFMVWMMFAVSAFPSRSNSALNETQFGILVASRVLAAR